MISEHIEKAVGAKLGEIPTNDQKKLIGALSNFIFEGTDDEVFIVGGYAGTGKTSIIAAFINTLDDFKLKTSLLAPTGRAAKVLSAFSGKTAFTIHKKIYRQKTSKDGLGKFVLAPNLNTDTIFMVDEASMIGNQSVDASIFGSGNLLADLLVYVYAGKRCKLVLIGDTAQLPPVNTNLSPALDPIALTEQGFKVKTATLTEVVRQSAQSAILENATLIRECITQKRTGIPKIRTFADNEFIKLSGADLIEQLTHCYETFGVEETIVVTRSNKRANIYNSGIRKQILYRDEEIMRDDYLMVVKNNYYWLKPEAEADESGFIANGDIVQVVKLGKFEERYGFRFVNAKVRLVDMGNDEVDVKLLLDTLNSESAALPADGNKKLFYNVLEDYEHLKPKKKSFDAVKENPYFNALQIKFAYAVTCHKAQGGQWKSVFVDPGYFTPDMMDTEYLRWLYTAFTRASTRLYLVNFTKDFFDE